MEVENQDDALKGKTFMSGQLKNMMITSQEDLHAKEPRAHNDSSPDDPIINLNIQPGQTTSAKQVLNSDSDDGQEEESYS